MQVDVDSLRIDLYHRS